MAKITRSKKAIISNLSTDIVICDADVTEINDDSAILSIEIDFVEDLDTEVKVTFFDELKGLVTYHCSLNISKKRFKDGIQIQDIICLFGKVISVIDRREDYKIEAKASADVIIPEDAEIPDDYIDYAEDEITNIKVVKADIINISAGGVYFTSTFPFKENHICTIYLHLNPRKRIKATAEVLRIDEKGSASDTGYTVYGFGCRFLDLSSVTEQEIRSFVFKQQMLNREKLSGR